MRFDYIIIGAGSAGCVLANRLSADERNSVLLIEAGPDFPPGSEPADITDSFAGRAYYNPNYTWQNLRVHLKPVPHNQPDLVAPRRYEQARLVGGGSSINGMMANRGIPADYDEWARLGARGWGWEDVLPYFRKLERDLQFGGPLHGSEGPIPIRRLPREVWPGFTQAIATTLADAGYKYVEDQNGEFEESFFPIAIANANNRRASAAMGYLSADVRKRPNLKIWAETTADRILFAGRQATGVRLRRDGRVIDIKAHEVILTAGAIHSPAILMRSGVGPAPNLRLHGIDVVADVSGVGRNLQDHPALSVTGHLRFHARMPRGLRRQMFIAMRYSSNAEGCDPLDMYTVAINQAGWHPLGKRLGSLMTWLNRTYSTGHVTLASADLDTPPSVAFNLLSDERDLVRMKQAVRFMASLFAAPKISDCVTYAFPTSYSERVRQVGQVTAWNFVKTLSLGWLLDCTPIGRATLINTLVTQGVRLDALLADCDALEQWVKDNAIGAWHASCTCRMGNPSDPSSVVDSEGRVHRTGGLRVADASIMPFVPRANTNIPVLMIGEKISDLILKDARGSV